MKDKETVTAQDMIDSLGLEKTGSPYIIGYDSYGKNESKVTVVLFDKNTNEIKYATTKTWRAKLLIVIARILGWKILKEHN